MTVTREIIHQKVHEFALFLLVIALPLSKFLLSLAQLILVFNWLLWGNPILKFKTFFSNRLAVVVTSLFFLHVLGLAYTEDFNYALKDLRIKLPLLALPIILSTSHKFSLKKTFWLLGFFAASVVFGTLASTIKLSGIFSDIITDTRKISIFISHIRFSLMICLVIFLAAIGISFSTKKIQYTLAGLITWLLFFLFIFESITGIVVLGALGVTFSLLGIFYLKSKILKGLAICSFLLIPSLLFFPIVIEWNQSFNVPAIESLNIESHSIAGEEYYNNLNRKELENGNYVWIKVSWNELKVGWNEKSNIDFDAIDKKGQPLHATLIRYLASKGLSKDKVGIGSLKADEIKLIEKGVTNYRFPTQTGINARLYKILWEFDHYYKGGNPGGNSVMQRLEFWKAGYVIAKQNPLIGVGTGDLKKSFYSAYEEIKTQLQKKYWLRAHNQYFTIFIAFGFLGFIWFLTTLFYPLFFFPKSSFWYPYLGFLVISLVSFLSEDTLETQIGVTFFAFFNSFFLFGYQKD